MLTRLVEFEKRYRSVLETRASNEFGTSFGQVLKYCRFLWIVRARHEAAAGRFLTASTTFRTIAMKSKKLDLAVGFMDDARLLKATVSDHRDYEIAHAKGRRIVDATTWGPGGEPRMVRTRIYPSERDQVRPTAESRPIGELQAAVEQYLEKALMLIEANKEKSRYRSRLSTAAGEQSA
jgi:hypothetical protein